MAAPQEGLLIVEPNDQLEFYGPFNEVRTSTIKLSNPTSDRVTFKVKTTVPKRYCVRPSCGTVEPQDSVSVLVMLQPFDCDSTEKNKHKFMIQSMILDGDSNANLEQLWKDAPAEKIMATRLKCALRLQDELLSIKPAELIFEMDPHETATCMVTAQNTSSKSVCFKVKTNAPKRYIVYPNEGIIQPEETKPIKVSTAPNAEPTGDSRDKLVFMTTIAPDDVRLDQVWQTVDRSKISEKLLMCTIKPRGSVDQVSNAKGLEQEIIQLRKENAELRESHERLRRLGAENVSLAGPQGEGQGLMRMANIPPILYLLVTFLVALLVGKFVL
uniref:MSP domain-containing protein n=1 Tax=Schistocephalus solidus TaxID=70667 RepID=A0A0X3NP84_SCHSO